MDVFLYKPREQEPQKERRAAKPVFDVVVEMEGEFLEDGEHPRCAVTVVKRVGAVVDELLATGHVPKPEMRAPLLCGAGFRGTVPHEVGVCGTVRHCVVPLRCCTICLHAVFHACKMCI